MNNKYRTPAGITTYLYRAMVQIDDFFYITKPNSKALDVMPIALSYPIKFLKDQFNILRIYSDAMIPDLYDQLMIRITGHDHYFRRVAGVFDSIVDQVAKCIEQMNTVCMEDRSRRLRLESDRPRPLRDNQQITGYAAF